MYGYQAAEILDVEGLEIYCVTLTAKIHFRAGR